MNLILKVENISYSVFQKNEEKVILKNISFELERNSVLGISGESGSGKTTLAKILAGILTPTSGKINYFCSRENKKVSPVQILFQNTGEIINPLRDVEAMLDEAIRKALSKSPPKGETFIEKELEKLIDIVRIPKRLLKRKGYELSGGEQQRTALARILAVKPELLILDEPFSAQDYESQENFLNLFLNLKKNLNITMICVAHNLRLLRKLSDEVMIMYNGGIVEKNKSEELFTNPQHQYTKFLLKAEKYDLSYEEFKEFKKTS
ncbi:MAG: ATP-binding cassette domain-containing protein [Ignavibacteria bacterium]|nr:ATP-binding cassette domain-containing protein [Ignavibacteria bacterium]